MAQTTKLEMAVSELNTSYFIPLIDIDTEWGDNEVDQACHNAIMFVRRRQAQLAKVVEEIDKLQRGR